MRAALSWLLLPALLGCGASHSRIPCARDSACPANQVCFADGCGDPGEDLVVEVTPTGTDSVFPQQFAVQKLEGTQDFSLAGSAYVAGTFLRATAADGGANGALPFTDAVSLIASGTPPELPDAPLLYQMALVPQGGAYSLEVASGTYQVSAYPHDPTIPPFVQSGLGVARGTTVALDILFPAPGQGALAQGTLEKAPGLPLDVAMSVQAFADGGRPLSQRVALDGGAFTVTLSPDARALPGLALTFSPTDLSSVAPQKTFWLPGGPGTDAGASLDLGDDGSPLTVSGTLLTGQGLPVANAAVHLEETVTGGGTYTSQVVYSDARGAFSLSALANDPAQPALLVAIPPGTSSAGILAEPVTVAAGASALGTLSCPDRISVTGTVLLPDGVSPAVGVTVAAVPLAASGVGHPLPAFGDKAFTDASGQFTLHLDPAQYRMDFTGYPGLPWTSVFAQIDGSQAPVSLPTAVLSKGKQVSGTVRFPPAPGATAAMAPVAVVRYLHRVQGPAGVTGVPLGQSVTDTQGRYVVTIPTR